MIILNLKKPQIIGLWIKDNTTFTVATTHQKGAIIGSTFIKHSIENGAESVAEFVEGIR